MSELSRSEIDQIAQFFVVESMRIGKRGDGSPESVLIRYNTADPSCVEFALRVEEGCWKQGAHTLLRPINFGRERVKLSTKPESSLKETEPLLLRIAETQDFDVYIGEYDDHNFTAGALRQMETRRASSHLDMIKSMQQGELYVDGKLVMRNGAPVS